jgi:pimeloyl-ACP methyl ester carboxylesterase
MPYFQARDGTKIFYQFINEVAQKGLYPLVLVHGGLVHSGSWFKQVQSFKTNFPVLTYDLRGYGQSEGSKNTFNIPQFADDLLILLETLELSKINLLGFSLGGGISQYFAATNNERVNCLLLESTTYKYNEQGKQLMKERAENLRLIGLEQEVNLHIKKAFSEKYFNENPDVITEYRNEISNNDPNILASTLETLAEWNGEKLLSRILAPTLILHGELDQAMPFDTMKKIQNYIKDIKFKTFKNTGHTIHFEKSQEFNLAVTNFIKKGIVI